VWGDDGPQLSLVDTTVTMEVDVLVKWLYLLLKALAGRYFELQ